MPLAVWIMPRQKNPAPKRNAGESIFTSALAAMEMGPGGVEEGADEQGNFFIVDDHDSEEEDAAEAALSAPPKRRKTGTVVSSETRVEDVATSSSAKLVLIGTSRLGLRTEAASCELFISATEGLLLKRTNDGQLVQCSNPKVPYSMLWKELKGAVDVGVIILRMNAADRNYNTVDIYLNANLLTMESNCVANPKLLEWSCRAPTSPNGSTSVV